MDAVLIATGARPTDGLGEETDLPELRKLVCRPWIEHVVEQLAARGVGRFTVLLCDRPEEVRRVLGNGERWGVTVSFQTVRDPGRPYNRLKAVAGNADGGRILLAHADRLPDLSGVDSFERVASDGPVLFETAANGTSGAPSEGARFTGYAVLDPDCFNSLTAKTTEATLAESLYARVLGDGGRRISVPHLLDARSAMGLLEAHSVVLRKQFPGILMKNNEIEEGVWFSRNVVLHPTAKVNAPVYIGPDCRIEDRVSIGPDVVLGRQCVVDRKAIVQNAVVGSKSYVGEGLEVCDSIVDRNRLVNARIGAAVSISENFLLGSLHNSVNRAFWQVLPSILAGWVLLLVSLPVQVLLFGLGLLRAPKAPWYGYRFVRLPASGDPLQWRTGRGVHLAGPVASEGSALPPRSNRVRDFLLIFLPGLWSVASGQLHLVGLPPRTPEQVQALPENWRNLYRTGKAGLITENMVVHDASTDPDDSYAAETFYAATASALHDLKLFAGYCGKVLASLVGMK